MPKGNMPFENTKLTLYKRTKFKPGKMKAFADDKLEMAETAEFLPDRIENIVGNKKILVTSIFSIYSIFSFSHNISKKPAFPGCTNTLPNDKFFNVTKLKAFAEMLLK